MAGSWPSCAVGCVPVGSFCFRLLGGQSQEAPLLVPLGKAVASVAVLPLRGPVP